ncbi:MAG: MoaD/ThiS family protein [Anaerolineales bacterium]
MIQVLLPTHLRRLAGVARGVSLEVPAPVTLGAVLDELERLHPALRGTIRDHSTKQRRDFVRFFMLQEDWSHASYDVELPEVVVQGREPLRIVGAMAGG